ncbi:maltase-glucoamylase-like [Haliotis asinina]|uniref:maltase-glucoamylase-like n=1 Tax=Haliotis asinina TaxID=109174 RepID=UPI0035324884
MANLSKKRIVIILSVIVVAVAIIAPTAYYLTRPSDPEDEVVTLGPPTNPEAQRLDCYPEAESGLEQVTKESCEARNCIFAGSGQVGPECYFPMSGYGYSVTGTENTPLGFKVFLKQNGKAPFGGDINSVVFEVQMRDDDILRFTIDDPNSSRYKVPVDLNLPSTKAADAKYNVVFTNQDAFAFQVTRKATGKVIWDTGVGGLTFSDQFLQIATRLPSDKVYGLGENHHKSFKHDLTKTWPMWSRDQPPWQTPQSNLYGVHPFYICVEDDDGNSHGVLLLNSNAQDYSFTDKPSLIYRTTGGILDFYVFMGSTANNAVQQYTQVIGRPFMPPYWALGFQLSRYGYNNIDNLRRAVENTRRYDIPHDVQYVDIDHMDEQKDFTVDDVNFPGLNDYFNELRKEGMKTIIILDPCLISNETNYEPYERMKAARANIKWPSDYTAPDDMKDETNAVLGYVWPKGKVVFPDFFKNFTREIWSDLIVTHRRRLVFDGLWIDMNEPANFGTNEERPFNWPEDARPYWSLKCPQNKYEDPPYRTRAAYGHDGSGKKARLSDKTTCLSTVQGESDQYRHYDVHSLYGWSQTQPTLRALQKATGKRGIVISRSTFPGSGKDAGHWLGDNKSDWEDMRLSIIGILEFNLFGIPYIGADICGFFDNTTAELCGRWMQLGAFYTFSRNHNGLGYIDQDPGALGDEVARISREAMRTRYSLLPYLYHLFHLAHTIGEPVIRSLALEFPYEKNVSTNFEQFLWGGGLLISPILYENQTALKMYFPGGRWYNFYTLEETTGTGQEHVEIAVKPDTPIQLHIRGGYIVITQEPGNNTQSSRKNPLTLKIALSPVYTAKGWLFWDDGESIDTYENGNYYSSTFNAENNVLDLTIEHNSDSEVNDLYIDDIFVLGVNIDVNHVRLISESRDLNFTFDAVKKILRISDHLPVNKPFQITWTQETSDHFTRIDCYPEALSWKISVTKEECEKRNCVFDNSTNAPFPACYFRQENYGYSVSGPVEQTTLGFRVPLTRLGAGPFGNDVQNITFNVEMRGNDVLRFTFNDPVEQRFTVPLNMTLSDTKGDNPTYDLIITNNHTFSFQIVRKSTGMVIWDTGVGGLTFDDQFLQISTRLPSPNVYGLGENLHASFRHNSWYKTWPMFSRDQPTVNAWGTYNNHYGVHPYYMCVEEDGNSHGVLLLNSNAQDYTFSPMPMLTYRTTGGILDFYVFLGPTPDLVTSQYTTAIGRPFIPPYWALGFQLSRYGYNHIQSMKDAVQRTRDAGIPHDVQYADIDHMDERKDFTVDNVNFPGLGVYFQELQRDGMKAIIILDPALISNVTGYEPYERMKAIRGNIMWPNSSSSIPTGSQDTDGAVLGYVWPQGKTVFPDFFKSQTNRVWRELIVKHYNEVPFDGLWIDMNEPANFGTNEEKPFNWPEKDQPYWSLKCTNNKYDDPPYVTRAAYNYDNDKADGRISDKTLCMVARQGENDEYRHYDVHSLYGWSQTMSTLQGLQEATGKRGIVISRSTFPGSGKQAGHWLGDNRSDWDDMRLSIIGILEFNLFGIPYIGADICGFFDNTTAELCGRWMQLGAFYTFSRNHNGLGYINQDPGAFDDDIVRMSREAMNTRYRLLPYLYSLFYFAHTKGETVIRALVHVFPKDKNTYNNHEQFLWGGGLLISPILYEKQKLLRMYIPDGRWYNYYTVKEVTKTGQVYLDVPVKLDTPAQLHLRGGHIIVTQEAANNTHFSRKNPFTVLVPLSPVNTAKGWLYWDDGESIDTYENGNYYSSTFTTENNVLDLTIEHNSASEVNDLYIDDIFVLGVNIDVNHVRLISESRDLNFTFDAVKKILRISDHLPVNKPFQIAWTQETSDHFTRIDCYPEALSWKISVTKEECEKRNCVFDNSTNAPIPACYFRQENYGYSVSGPVEQTTLGFRVPLTRLGAGPFGNDVQNITFNVEMRGNDVLRFTFNDPVEQRFTVPLNMTLSDTKGDNPTYDMIITNNHTFSFQIVRKSTGMVIWDTGVGGLTFDDQFLQISTRLPSPNAYGFGENLHASFRHNSWYKTWPMFSRDQPTVNAWGTYNNHYGVHPYYMCVEDDGNAHGVLLLNSNAQDYTFSPMPMLTYRTTGGILDFYVFLGPTPDLVTSQYTTAIGRPFIPPYWALGFQLSRYGYNHIQSMKDAVQRTRDAGIPHDVQYADIDHMDERKDFTVDNVSFPGLGEYFQELQRDGMKAIIILDPALISNVTGYEPYERMKTVRGNIMWPNSSSSIPAGSQDTDGAVLGYVWPKGKTVFPDFFKSETNRVWQELIVKHYNEVPFDGLWIDMNEPANFGTNEEKPFNWPDKDQPYWSLKCTNNKYDDPPYVTRAAYNYDNDKADGRISDKTLCMVTRQGENDEYRHYDVHSLYGWSQTMSTLQGLQEATGKRGIVISRSTFPGSGKQAGHWLGDNRSDWDDMRLSIIGILEFNLFGIPYIGADICGFFDNTTAELCGRWMQLGAFYTFSRNHNGLGYINQDPGAFGDDIVRMSREAMNTRYRLLPYLYSLFYFAHTKGETVIRALVHVFPKDKNTYNNHEQFLWGGGLLISPILYEKQKLLRMYIPDGRWYNYYTMEEVTKTGQVYLDVPVKLDTPAQLHLRGGHIIVTQEAANNTHFSRKNPFTVLVPLSPVNTAKGWLYWDDGESIDTYENGNYYSSTFNTENNVLDLTIEHNSASEVNDLYIDDIFVLGVNIDVNHVRLISESRDLNFTFDAVKKILRISDHLPVNKPFQIAWTQETSDHFTRIDCYPEALSWKISVTKEECEKRNCVFDNSTNAPIPACYFRQENYGYSVSGPVEQTTLGFRVPLTRLGAGPFGNDVQNITFNVEMRGNDVLRFTFNDPVEQRFTVPLNMTLSDTKGDNPTYDMIITNNHTFSFQIVRKSTGMVIWDTGVGGLTFDDQFLQISTRLPSPNAYGFGENLHASFRHNSWYKTWPMFSRDQPTVNAWGTYNNHYGVHPYYMCVEDDGNAHGVLLLNSNAQDYTFSPMPMLTYRTTGGILDFYVFLGPTPDLVTSQYTTAIGRPFIPPYWALGFQLSRYGYNHIQSMKDAVQRTRDAGIPHDVQYADIDHMDERKDFTVDNVSFPGLGEYFQELQRDGMKAIIILDPALISNVTGYEPYERMKTVRGNIMWPNSSSSIPAGSQDTDGAVLGYVWPKGKTVFPDFFKPETNRVWRELIVKHYNKVPFDGLWIDMNEPANFGTNEEKPFNWPDKDQPYWSLKCTNNKYDDPPYVTRAAYNYDNDKADGRISDKTLCMVTRQGENDEYRHYDVHSLYGWSQTMSTLQGLQEATGKRGIVISRSTFPGSGKQAGHWLGDNRSDWDDMRLSIIGILEFNLFGIPYIGADICGFFDNTTAELCGRWMQLGAFYTFSRNHNGLGYINQDPGAFDDDIVRMSREAMNTRYRLLPYLYSLFYFAHTKGETVIRALVHVFPKDKNTYNNHEQFLWGGGLLISPILYEKQKLLRMYIPNGRWYNFYTMEEVTKTGQVYLDVPVKLDTPAQLHLRGGHIIVTQEPANNTHFSRKNPFTVLVPLSSVNTAKGWLYWDDGESIDTYERGNYYMSTFNAHDGILDLTIDHNTLSEVDDLYIDSVVVLGVEVQVNLVRLVTDNRDLNFTYDGDKKVLKITDDLPVNQPFQLRWTSASADDYEKIDCYPEVQGNVVTVNETSCMQRYCIYADAEDTSVPDCYFRQSNYGYSVSGDVEQTPLGFRIPLTRIESSPGPFGNDINNLTFEVEELDNNLLRFKFYDPSSSRYEVPVPLELPKTRAVMPRYRLDITNNETFSFRITRLSSGAVIWDTGVGGFTFDDQFLQIATRLPSTNIYGFGENTHDKFRHNLWFKTWPMWSRDQWTMYSTYENHYGVHPFYMAMEDDGQSHGVLLLNSNAQDYSFTPLPMLIYRTIGGILDFYLFMGPEPESVVQQYTQVIGRPYMPPYWSLGFQLCRYGYNNLSSIQEAVNATKNAGIPHDVQYVDIDHMDERKDFTVDDVNFPGLNDYFNDLRAGGMRNIIILDPALVSNNTGYVPYEAMKAVNGNIMWPSDVDIPEGSNDTDNALLGYVWPMGKTVFPDFFKNATRRVWGELINNHSRTLFFDGLWIDMNEPANFGTNEEKPFNWPDSARPYWSLKCPTGSLEDPPYRTRASFHYDKDNRLARISDKTICMTAVQGERGEYQHYNVHSLYGWSQTQPTLRALQHVTGKRGIVVTRSTFPGSGKHSGHWLGDNASKWRDMVVSVTGILEFNLFGIPYIGADICGFFEETTPELCKRWMQLGAFYTYSRNHNGIDNKRQDPGSLGEDVARASREAMETRYRLLPYLYTLFHRAHSNGNTVIRPLHHEYPRDETAYRIDRQFLWGAALMISPILHEGQTSLSIYVPQGRWYDWYTGDVASEEGGSYLHIPINPESQIPLHVRGGHILPLQDSANNTHFSRQTPFTLIVALEDLKDQGLQARGELFWDDGEGIDTYENGNYYYAMFDCKENKLTMNVTQAMTGMDTLRLQTVEVWGLTGTIQNVTVNDSPYGFVQNKTLTIRSLDHPMSGNLQISWT